MPKRTPVPPEQRYTFEHRGKTYWIASAVTKYDQVEGRLLRDAYMDDTDAGETRLGFTLLEMVDAQDGAVDALYAMPAPEMLTIFREWLQFRPSEEDAELGESSASSD